MIKYILRYREFIYYKFYHLINCFFFLMMKNWSDEKKINKYKKTPNFTLFDDYGGLIM